MKRTVTLLALLAALCCFLTVTAGAEAAIVDSGTCGENLTWALDPAGTLTISGTGEMEEYESGSRAPWYKNCDSIKAVVIETGVTSIGSHAFWLSYRNLARITISDSVASIGNNAFTECTGLTDVSITNMDAWCRIDFEDTYATPMRYAKNILLNGNKIAAVTVPEGVTELNYTFYGFKDLIRVTLPKSLTGIGEETFRNCSSLTNLTIPDGVTTIGYGAFSGCTSLASVTIPASVTTIGNDAFSWCSSLTSITIPESVTAIGSRAFSYCDALADASITDLDAWFQIEFADGFASPFYYAKNLYLNGQLVESLEIPGSVSVIPAGLFRNAKCLKRVAIPRSLAGVAGNAFEKCTNIKEVFYEGSESEWANLPISAGNDPLKNAQVYFGSTLENYYCRITVAVSDGGRVTVDHTTAKVGETVTVTAAPYPGYELAAICVDGVDIEGDTFTVTGNHVVSARFSRVPVVGGNEDFRLEGISVRTAAGETLQELPAESLLVTVAVKHLKETGSGTILLAQYDAQGRYRGLMWLTLDEMPQGMTLRVTLPVDNSGGEIANLKVFVVEDLTSPLPVGTPVSFGQV